MAIYLDQQTRTYLERKFKVVADTDFIGKRIQGMLKADREVAERVAGCEHDIRDYYGTKKACAYCARKMQVNWSLSPAVAGEQPITREEQ